MRSPWRIVVVVKVESYRLTFTNNPKKKEGEARAPGSGRCRPTEHYEALKGVPLVSVAWFRVPLLSRTVRERLRHASVNSRLRYVVKEPTNKGPQVPRSTGKPEMSESVRHN